MPPGVAHGSTIDLYLTTGGVAGFGSPGQDRAHRPGHHRPVGHRPGVGRPVRRHLEPLSALGAATRRRCRQAGPDPADRGAHRRSGERRVNTGLLTAGSGQGWENELVAALDRPGSSMTVLRRCVDIGDVLAVATTGQAAVAIVSADLRRLDTEAVARLRTSGVAVVGVHPAGDERARARLERIGITALVPDDAGTDAVLAAVRGGRHRPGRPGTSRPAGCPTRGSRCHRPDRRRRRGPGRPGPPRPGGGGVGTDRRTWPDHGRNLPGGRVRAAGPADVADRCGCVRRRGGVRVRAAGRITRAWPAPAEWRPTGGSISDR